MRIDNMFSSLYKSSIFQSSTFVDLYNTFTNKNTHNQIKNNIVEYSCYTRDIIIDFWSISKEAAWYAMKPENIIMINHH